ncbi:MAG: hypothetical protein KYX67_02095 [Brevundimonas sp.]|uniref:Tat pathway signal protein n=1 Tax=Brevundimonas mediterranea TaxID=74329 RepID=A0A7W6A0T0_9CAUL|nr:MULTISPECIES: hypothetical protein [Brevundimonas]MBB3871139.1 hypothetical protein [Brevundimonas mediterranea]MDK2746092.1 hypothetical protein [Brevundimonas sp.]
MDRRTLITSGTVALAGVAATSAQASSSKTPAEAPALSIPGVGLPVIADGRLRNYVFVSLKLHLGGGKTVEQMRPKEAFFRDALVKAAHRTPFTVAGDWTRLDENRMSAALVAAANAISGRGSVARAEIIAQNPRLRAGMTPGV